MLNARNQIAITSDMVHIITLIGKYPETKKLKKKYIGRNYVSDDEQKDQHKR